MPKTIVQMLQCLQNFQAKQILPHDTWSETKYIYIKQGHTYCNSFNWVVATINIISHKKVICIWTLLHQK